MSDVLAFPDDAYATVLRYVLDAGAVVLPDGTVFAMMKGGGK